MSCGEIVVCDILFSCLFLHGYCIRNQQISGDMCMYALIVVLYF